MDRVTVIGTPVSPYVRKVLVCLEIKKIPYQVDPIVAFFTGDAFTKLSPVRRIPVLIDGDVTIADSSVICDYLEDAYPDPPIFPSSPADRARARWYDEYSDTLMGDVLIWKLFNQAVVNPSVWREERDLDALRQTIEEDIPPILDYLEGELPEDGFLFGDMTIADISLAAPFRNAAFARFTPDDTHWPKLAAWLDRVLGSAPFQKLAAYEDALMKVPIPGQRACLEEMGFPLTEDTYLVDGPPRPGPLTVRTG